MREHGKFGCPRASAIAAVAVASLEAALNRVSTTAATLAHLLPLLH